MNRSSSWCWWKSKMHHNTFVVATVLLGPLSNPRNRGEADLICGQILTPASFPFPPSSLLTIISTEVGFPGRSGLLSCCFQLDPSTNTDLISGQILVRSRAQILAPATGCSIRLFAFTSPDSTPVVLHLVHLIIMIGKSKIEAGIRKVHVYLAHCWIYFFVNWVEKYRWSSQKSKYQWSSTYLTSASSRWKYKFIQVHGAGMSRTRLASKFNPIPNQSLAHHA